MSEIMCHRATQISPEKLFLADPEKAFFSPNVGKEKAILGAKQDGTPQSAILSIETSPV